MNAGNIFLALEPVIQAFDALGIACQNGKKGWTGRDA